MDRRRISLTLLSLVFASTALASLGARPAHAQTGAAAQLGSPVLVVPTYEDPRATPQPEAQPQPRAGTTIIVVVPEAATQVPPPPVQAQPPQAQPLQAPPPQVPPPPMQAQPPLMQATVQATPYSYPQSYAYVPDARYGASVDPELREQIAEPQREQMPTFGRLALELLGAAAGYGLGALIGWGVSEETDQIGFGILAGIGVATFAVPLGTMAIGRACGGQGGFGPSLLGTVIGGGLASLAALGAMSEDMPELAIAAAIVLPIAGSLLGFEIHHGARSARAQRQDRAGVSLDVISAAPTRDGEGAIVTAAGTF